MAGITTVQAYANNEVAYIAWDVDSKIAGCLGFEIVRVYLNPDGGIARRNNGVEDRVTCASWVPFQEQRNPHWLPQTTTIWPVQKLSWRDLTLRKRRDRAKLRPSDVRVRYEVRPLGDMKPGLEAAGDPSPASVLVTRRDSEGKPLLGGDGKPVKEQVKAYEGEPRRLGYLGPAVSSNPIHITRRRGAFQSTFTNGILAAQWLRNVLLEDGVIGPHELLDAISTPGNPIRKYLSGDIPRLLRELFERPGSLLLALYELDDPELLDLLIQAKDRIRIILSNTSRGDGGWDARNAHARQRLINAGVDIQHRMFNNTKHIGHNKFVVHLSPDGAPQAVLTGSANWTSTGLAGQTNNVLLIEDPAVADAFAICWRNIFEDPLAPPPDFATEMPQNSQGKLFRKQNETPVINRLAGGVTVETWFSPNMRARTKGKELPPDLREVYRLMRCAERAILFLAFYPAQRGKDCVIGEAIDIARKDQRLIVVGAVSSAQAMPLDASAGKNNPGASDDGGAARSPHVFSEGNVSIVRASRIEDRDLAADFGAEQLTATGGVGAIIHDKIVVIDPLSEDCSVILGSHNLGFKASYSNDENLVIIKGDKALAEAYAVHVLDVYDHYRFRAYQIARRRQGKKGWSGFLDGDDGWLDGCMGGGKGALTRYFARSRS